MNNLATRIGSFGPPRTRVSHTAAPGLVLLVLVLACQSPSAVSAPASAGQRQPVLSPRPDNRDDGAQRTPAQEKISSQLLDAITRYRDADGAVPRDAGVDVDAEGRALVDIDAAVTDDLLAAILTLGGTVVSSFPQYDAIRARVPLDQLEALAGRPAVRLIRPADKATTNRPGAVLPGR